MASGATIAIGIGAVAILGIGAVIIMNASNNANIQAQNFNNPNTGQPALQGDAALLYAGLSGGGNFLSGLFRGIGALNTNNNTPSQVNYGNYAWNPSQPIGPGNSPAAFGTPFQGGRGGT